MDSRLDDSNLDLNTMEGYIASKIYGCKTGDSVFRRIMPVAFILSWVEICENTRGQIRLLPKEESQVFENGEEFSLVPDIGEMNENSETGSISAIFDSRSIELKSLETKLAKNIE